MQENQKNRKEQKQKNYRRDWQGTSSAGRSDDRDRKDHKDYKDRRDSRNDRDRNDSNGRGDRGDREFLKTDGSRKEHSAYPDKPKRHRYPDQPYRGNTAERSEEEGAQAPVENGAVIGRNAVRELLKSGRSVDKLMVQRGERTGSIVVLVAEAIQRGIPVIEVEKAKLDALSGFAPHQGVIGLAAEKEYCEVEDILKLAESRGEAPLIVIADGITDPYNLGALIRCAEGVGAHGLILPKRHASGLTPLVTKASAGAIEHLAIAKVSNLTATIRSLQEKGVWVFAAEAGGQEYYACDFTGPCALVFGSEGDGVSRLVKETCDVITSIPMYGHVNSFNVSTAAAVILAEASRQHRNGK